MDQRELDLVMMEAQNEVAEMMSNFEQTFLGNRAEYIGRGQQWQGQEGIQPSMETPGNQLQTNMEFPSTNLFPGTNLTGQSQVR